MAERDVPADALQRAITFLDVTCRSMVAHGTDSHAACDPNTCAHAADDRDFFASLDAHVEAATTELAALRVVAEAAKRYVVACGECPPTAPPSLEADDAYWALNAALGSLESGAAPALPKTQESGS